MAVQSDLAQYAEIRVDGFENTIKLRSDQRKQRRFIGTPALQFQEGLEKMGEAYQETW